MSNVPPSETQFDRAAWATLALALLLVCGSVALAFYRLGLPDDGITLWLGQGRPGDGLLVSGGGQSILAVDDRDAAAIVAGALLLQPDPPPAWRIGGEPVYRFTSPVGDYHGRMPLRAAWSPRFENPWSYGILIYLPIAVIVFARRPRLPAAQLLLLFTACLLASTATRLVTNGWSELRLADLFAPGTFWPTFLLNGGIEWFVLIHFALVFPRPKPLFERHRLLVLGVLYGLPALWLIGAAFWSIAAGQPLRFFALTLWPGYLVAVAGPLIILWSLSHSYRHARDAIERVQVLWGGLGLALLSAWIMLILAVLLLDWLGLPVDAVGELPWNLSIIAFLAPAVCLAIAILRYRLFEIDLVVNRALVYGALTVLLAGATGIVQGGLGLLVHGSGGWTATLLAVGVAGALFHPLRERLQRWVNRAMYGDRDEPYTALARLGDRLGGTIAPDEVLPTIVATVAEALRAPYVAITSLEPDVPDSARSADVILAEYPVAGPGPVDMAIPGDRARFSLVHQGQSFGQLVVAPRVGEVSFSAADLRLLHQLAGQAGAAVHAARLTADLRRSRELLVAAQEEERRRLQRDLHDGLGPAMAGLTLKIDAARNLLARDTAAADRTLVELRGQIQSTVDDLRRLVHGLRPPKLDQYGLLGAIEDLADLSRPQVAVDLQLPDTLPTLPAAVEVAAYRIIQEALTNVVRHSAARHCLVRLECAGNTLRLDVQDDGRGLPGIERNGVGMQSMVARAVEIGGRCSIVASPPGGTHVHASLPLGTELGEARGGTSALPEIPTR